MKWIWIVVLPNLVGYVAWLVHLPAIVTIVLLVISLIVAMKIVFKEPGKLSDYWLTALAAPLILATAFVLSPLANQVSLDGFVFERWVSTTDFFKHSYTITTLMGGEVPPKHPFYPSGDFGYYLGYYFVPAWLSRVWPTFQLPILYVYVVTTGIIAWMAIGQVVNTYLKTKWAKILVMAGLVFGTGLDIWPTILENKIGSGKLIELWAITHDLGLRIDNTFISYLWTPQHFFAAAIGLVVWNWCWRGIVKNWLLALLVGYVFISSVFVAMAMMWGLFVIWIVKPKFRKQVIGVIIMGLLIAIPMGSFMAGRANIFERYTLMEYPFGESSVLNRLYSMVTEYGLVMFGMPIWLLFVRKRVKKWWVFVLMGIPILISWFVKSSGYNDFVLRGTLMWQLVGTMFVGRIAELEKGIKRITIVGVMMVSVGVSGIGFGYEFLNRWKENMLVDSETSALLQKVRNEPREKKWMAIGREEWIYLIPSLAGKPILTSSLYDSAQYLNGPAREEHSYYEGLEREIFFESIKGDSNEEIIKKVNKKLNLLEEYFNAHISDELIIEKANPWAMILAKVADGERNLTGKYVGIDLNKLREGFKTKKVTVAGKGVGSEVGIGIEIKCVEKGCEGKLGISQKKQNGIYWEEVRIEEI